uniref:Uncharacterized protein n=1 Tax=Cucumis melo TaxID=3656 RepID=A0A9I9EBP1_CUCME
MELLPPTVFLFGSSMESGSTKLGKGKRKLGKAAVNCQQLEESAKTLQDVEEGYNGVEYRSAGCTEEYSVIE